MGVRSPGDVPPISRIFSYLLTFADAYQRGRNSLRRQAQGGENLMKCADSATALRHGTEKDTWRANAAFASTTKTFRVRFVRGTLVVRILQMVRDCLSFSVLLGFLSIIFSLHCYCFFFSFCIRFISFRSSFRTVYFPLQ